jgi:large subunit ribosomal protein L10
LLFKSYPKGGEPALAFTKEHKTEMLKLYETWLNQSQAMILLEYKGMTMKDVDTLRDKVRDMGAEVHVVKNTLLGLAMKNAGLDQPENFLEGSTAVSFAFRDPPALAKAVSDALVKNEIFKIKGGYLGAKVMSPAEIKSLADLPPLPVLQARLLGVLMAPASQLARTLAEPARSLAAVVKAYSENTTEAAPAA